MSSSRRASQRAPSGKGRPLLPSRHPSFSLSLGLSKDATPLENTPPFPAELTHEGPKRNKNAHFHNSPPNAQACRRTGHATKHPRPGHSSVSGCARSQLPPPSQRSATPPLAFKSTPPARAGGAHAWCPGAERGRGGQPTGDEGRRGHGTQRPSGRTACRGAWSLPPQLSGVGLPDYPRGAATHAGHARRPRTLTTHAGPSRVTAVPCGAAQMTG